MIKNTFCKETWFVSHPFPKAFSYAVLRMHTMLGLVILLCLMCNIGRVDCQAQDTWPANAGTDRVDFSRDIRPIFSDTCFKCHGPDSATRQADLRLDSRESVFDATYSVVAGDPSESELFQRLISEDPDSLMPPPDSGRHLSPQQIELVKKWIEQGAQWGPHWSLVEPQRPPLPDLPKNVSENWPQDDLDRFVVSQLERRSLTPPSAPADRATLARRVALDLTGLPARHTWLQEFLADDSEDAYEKYVDRLMASPRYAEHMARYWLDVVRYADTHGLHLDNYREHWPYRDWIINAFATNKPYDQFAIEQLAGDLLPNPTREQLIATGFNRAHITTNEGGAIKDEVKMRNVVDRTSTFGTVFLGLTVGCAQCHDHKFDPISQNEFYSLYAYFNSLDGNPMDGNAKAHAPVLMVGDPSQLEHLDDLNQRIATIDQEIDAAVKQFLATYQEPEPVPDDFQPEIISQVWIDDALPKGGEKTGSWTFVEKDPAPVHEGQSSVVLTAKGNQQYVLRNMEEPWEITESDELVAYVWLDRNNPPRQIMMQWNDGNWDHRAYWGEDLIGFGKKNTPSRSYRGPLPSLGRWVRLSVPADEVNLSADSKINGVALTQFDGTVYWDSIGAKRFISPYPANRSLNEWVQRQIKKKGAGLPDPLKKLFTVDKDDWKPGQEEQVKSYFIRHHNYDSRLVIEPLEKTRLSVVKQRDQWKNKIPTTLIYREKSKPDPAYLLKRGQYDQPGEQVSRAVPAALPPLPKPQAGRANDRLALAEWLFTEKHPLTARVAVNRFWQQIFGRGLVETSEDFGAQGTFPTHPDLLDYLAVEFRDSGWDVKALVKRMVMSSTYRQQSVTTGQHLKRDPDNVWLARGRRYRLDAEVIRDQALAVSGLLVEKTGGPSVRPPQPDGLWFVVGYSGSNTVRFKKDTGHDKVHRRSMYTFWKRTAPAPQMNIMDAPSRETCIVRRERTNTPLQALMLMNDPQFVEAARYLAQRIIDECTDSDLERIEYLYRQCLIRSPMEKERVVVAGAMAGYRKSFAADAESAKKLLAIGESPASEDYDAIELATWTMVASLIMNLDEFITKN